MTVGPAATDAAQPAGLVELRRRLHQIPEIGLELPQTQAAVLEALAPLDLEVTTGRDCSSVTAVLRGGGSGGGRRAVLLRGDMDALPVEEDTGEPFASTNGAMHACGHDLHVSGLVGAAQLLAARRHELDGDVVLMFQPGEEGFDGAEVMIREGVLDAAGPRVGAGYGLHVFSSMVPTGVFTTRPGPLMASSARLSVTVRGRGGHASRPHAAADPIVVAAELVTALQTMVTRQFDVMDPVVITVGTFHAGTKRNIIPDSAAFEATVRTFTDEALVHVRDASVVLCTGLAEAHGLSADVAFEEEYPVTSNTPERADFALDVGVDLFGPDRSVLLKDPATGSEDFSRVLAEVGGAYVFLGACPDGDWRHAPTNHSPRARFDDAVLGDAAAYLAELAVRDLQRQAGAA